ncbi:hypothetical protein TVAG_299310 [Trichomonas vaginalis G3]|uniref:Uncharacterized protein n=1 Tax=Trichomonas vaginalis (strain ATCC PRA-98 / G3) TaxID=412133 RepID=A2EVQ8_TRIV3|nr:hypothetical protein TVAGG3_0414300 [Trichomonas vaginalis G3]EAY03268.1 hypothetical protein TVAG_299310 [Trichomonas vaginalis G3]KAI5535576.1 hypothetical protein TVAGG3_0414300 [Trichomonas vaginalis G3]|eukprot:XP_001315491.1 hypothetical protein [Trichomonas vaginalis G3]
MSDAGFLSDTFGPSDFGPTSSSKNKKKASIQVKPLQMQQPIRSQIPVTKISTSPYGEYTTLFLLITKLLNLKLNKRKNSRIKINDLFTKVFLRIRVHPDRPKIQTNLVVCINPDPIINCGYALDYSQVPPEDISRYTLAFELYTSTTSGEELIGIALLPPNLQEVITVDGKPLKFLARNKQIEFKSPTQEIVGSAIINVALGFEMHQEFFKRQPENGPEALLQSVQRELPKPIPEEPIRPQKIISEPIRQFNLHEDRAIDASDDEKPKKMVVQSQKQRSKSAGNDEDEEEEDNYEEEEEEEEEDERSRRRHRHRHHHHSRRHRSRDSSNWIQKAMLLGWRPPDYQQNFDWKEKARSKGWIPPPAQIKSSYGVQTDTREIISTKSAEVQTEPLIPDTPQPARLQSESASNDSPKSDNLFELLKAVNEPGALASFCSDQQESASASESGIDNNNSTIRRDLRMTNVLNVFSQEPNSSAINRFLNIDDDDDSSENYHEISIPPSVKAPQTQLISLKDSSEDSNEDKFDSDADAEATNLIKRAENMIESASDDDESPKKIQDDLTDDSDDSVFFNEVLKKAVYNSNNAARNSKIESLTPSDISDEDNSNLISDKIGSDDDDSDLDSDSDESYMLKLLNAKCKIPNN